MTSLQCRVTIGKSLCLSVKTTKMLIASTQTAYQDRVQWLCVANFLVGLMKMTNEYEHHRMRRPAQEAAKKGHSCTLGYGFIAFLRSQGEKSNVFSLVFCYYALRLIKGNTQGRLGFRQLSQFRAMGGGKKRKSLFKIKSVGKQGIYVLRTMISGL